MEIKYSKGIIKPSYARTFKLSEGNKEKLVKEFKKDCEDYYKRATAFSYTMALWGSQELNNKTITNLVFEKLLKLFEDGVEIPIEGTYNTLEKELLNVVDELRNKYESKIKASVLDKVYMDAMDRTEYGYTDVNYHKDEKYSLIDCITPNYKWAINFLTSKAPIENRINFYETLLANTNPLCLEIFIGYQSKMNDKEKKEKIDKLNKHIEDDSEELWNLLKKILGKYLTGTGNAHVIQRTKFLDFNKAINPEKPTPLEYLRRNLNIDPRTWHQRIELWMELFNGLDNSAYKRRELLDMILKLKMYPSQIKYILYNTNYVPSRHYGLCLCYEILMERDEIETQFQLDEYMGTIAETLMQKSRKAKNRKEYRQAIVCAKAFVERYNYYVDQENTYNKLLEIGRKHFTTQLHNLNENLQSSTPGKTLIKDIDFKK